MHDGFSAVIGVNINKHAGVNSQGKQPKYLGEDCKIISGGDELQSTQGSSAM
jgi:hypothetical protein